MLSNEKGKCACIGGENTLQSHARAHTHTPRHWHVVRCREAVQEDRLVNGVFYRFLINMRTRKDMYACLLLLQEREFRKQINVDTHALADPGLPIC